MFIDGPAELDEVIVTGRRPEANVWFPHHSMTSYDGNAVWEFNEEMFTGEYLWGDGALVDSYNSCEDRRADTLAEQINNEIAAQPDSDRVEYGALIWRDDSGQLRYTNVTPGNNGHWVPPSAPTGGGFHSWSQVVGYVHSHPTQVYQNNQWVNVPPESHFDRPSSGDWQTTDFYIGQGASAENFTVYISYNGQIREFDSRMNTSQSRSTAPMPGHGTESGTYQPGASCP